MFDPSHVEALDVDTRATNCMIFVRQCVTIISNLENRVRTLELAHMVERLDKLELGLQSLQQDAAAGGLVQSMTALQEDMSLLKTEFYGQKEYDQSNQDKENQCVNVIGASSQVGAVSPDPPSHFPSDKETHPQKVLSMLDKYAVEDSIWEIVLFVFLNDVLTYVDSTVLMLSLLVNAAAQGFACYILSQPTFVEPPIAGKELRALRNWRLTDAHSDLFADPARTPSLASRVCNEDLGLPLSTTQQALYTSLEEYTESGGQLLAVFAIAMWTCCCAAELRRSFSFGRALCHIPLSFHSRMAWHQDQWRLTSISYLRFFLGMVVFFVRMAIVILFLGCGCTWLLNTDNIKDLLLNASALGFVLDFDEIIYHAFVPLQWEEMHQRLEPLELPARSWKTYWTPILLFLLSVAFIVISEVIWLEPFIKTMDEAKSILCSGRQNFVYGMDAFSQVLWTSTAAHGEMSPQVESQQIIVQSIIDSDMEFAAHVAKHHQLPHLFNREKTLSTADFSQRGETPTCRDSYFEALGMKLWSVSGDDRFHNTSLATCWDVGNYFPELCEMMDEAGVGQFFRYYCPYFCRCNWIGSGYLHLGTDQYGCPLSKCKFFILAGLSSLKWGCHSIYPDRLRKDDNWNRLARVAEYLAPDFNMTPNTLRDDLLLNGCGALRGQLGWKICNYHHGASLWCPHACGCVHWPVGLPRILDPRERCAPACFTDGN